MLPWTFTCNFTATWKTQISHIKWFTESWWLHPSMSPASRPVVSVSSMEPDWIIEQRTEDSRKDWLPERSRGPMLNKNPQKLWEKARSSSIFTVSSHLCTLGEGRSWTLRFKYECGGDPKFLKAKPWLLWCGEVFFFPLLAKNCSFDANSGPLLCRWRKPQKQS